MGIAFPAVNGWANFIPSLRDENILLANITSHLPISALLFVIARKGNNARDNVLKPSLRSAQTST